MTDFTPGAIITRDNPLWDGDRPSWVQDDAMVRCTCCGNTKPAGNWYSWNELVLPEIELDASDIVYQCLEWNEAHPDEAPMWPHYGEGKPIDWEGGKVLLRNGETRHNSSYLSMWRRGYAGNPHLQAHLDIIGYVRRPTTSLPEPAEDVCDKCGKRWPAAPTGVVHKSECSGGICKPAGKASQIYRDALFSHVRGPERAHTSDYAETIEESPEDFARAACKRAGMVAVKQITKGKYHRLYDEWLAAKNDTSDFAWWLLRHFGIIRPDPTPLDIAKAEHPHIKPEDVERIAAIVKGKSDV